MASLVLASASARRRALLEELGLVFDAVPAELPEQPAPDEPAQDFARRAAREKVAAVAARAADRWILGADTVVVIDGQILGKPANRDHARRMLRRLSGRTHRVCTAVVLRTPDGRCALDAVATTTVAFRELSDNEIAAYLDTGEPADKAGAYAIQGGAAGFVVRIDGSYTNVVGLPMELVVPALQRAGLLADHRAQVPS